MDKYGRSLNHEAHVNSQEVSGELVEERRVEVVFVHECSPLSLESLTELLLIDIFIVLFMQACCLVEVELVEKILFLVKDFLDTGDKFLCYLILVDVMDSNVTCFFVIRHLRWRIVEFLLVSEHP